jgi:transcription elongation factor GreA
MGTSGSGRAGLSEQAKQRLREELAVLREQRDELGGGRADDDRGNDPGDSAETLRRADEVARIDSRINEINRLLAGGLPGVGQDTRGGLVDGSKVTLRFEDGTEETWRATAIPESVPEEEQDRALSLSSPLGRALAGHAPGDVVEYQSPDGLHRVELVKIQQPG